MGSMSTPLPYDREQISRWFDAGTVAKAIHYVKAVSNLEWGNDSLSGSVQGSAPEPYEVDVYFHRNGHRIEFDGDCTCPVGYFCKHVAALMMASLEHQSPHTTEVRAEVVGWLEGFRERLKFADAKKTKVAKATNTLVYALV